MYYVPQALENFILYNLQEYIPQQNPYKKSETINKNPIFDFILPSILWEFTEDLSGFLEGPMYVFKKYSRVHDHGDFTLVKTKRKSNVLAMFENEQISCELSKGQKWIEKLGFDNLGSMFIEYKKDFEDLAIGLEMTGQTCKPLSLIEMSKIESLIGYGQWQRVIPVKI